MTFQQAQTFIYQWLVLVEPSLLINWADENVKEEELTFPYLAIHLINKRDTGGLYRSNIIGSNQRTLSIPKELIIEIHAVSSMGGRQPFEILSNIVNSVKRDSVSVFMGVNKITFQPYSTILNISAILDITTEKRASVSFKCDYVETEIETIGGVIREVDIEATNESYTIQHVNNIHVEI
jgi:hypothetical protein